MGHARTSTLAPDERPRYLTADTPLHFPESAEMPESELHLELRTLLYHLLKDYLGQGATVGSEQFVYYDASDPKKALAPDVYVQLQPAAAKIKSWKVWERGAPDVAVEVLSDSDAPELAWSEKLRRYQALGVSELVCFSPEAPVSLRVWDRVEGRLRERAVEDLRAASLVLELTWVVAPAEGNRLALRLQQPSGQLVPTRVEAYQAEAKAREVEVKAREAAETRVRELEQLLQSQGKPRS